MASNTDNLYVTFVDIDHDLLKVWGQRNRIGATYIEKQLLQLIPEFNRTHSPNPSRISKGMFCFAKYTDDNYYRARVISNVQGDLVGVVFIDYGNRDFIKISNIRIQEGNEEDVLVKMAEQAEEYYLARIAAPSFGWTKDIVSQIRKDICYDEFPYHVADQVGDQKILEIQFHNEDFSNYLVKKQIARSLPLPLQKQMILSYCSLVSNDAKRDTHFRELQKMNFSPSELPQNTRSSYRQMNQGNEVHQQLNFEKPVNYPYPPPSHHPPLQYPPSGHINPVPHQTGKTSPKHGYFPPVNQARPIHSNSVQSVNPTLSPLLHNNPLYQMKNTPPFNNVIEVLAQQVKQYIAEDNAKAESEAEKIPHTYINSVLEVGSTYNVIVSYIDDGPWSFSIQLMSSEAKLKKLMNELSSCDLVPLKPPIILGHPCIALSSLYKTLCRGVIVSISHSAVKVYFVDFGNTEDLISSSIYELPPKFFKTRVLSQKFCLSGLQKVVYSDDIKKFFKEVVQDEVLILRVTSLEDDNLPTCELYQKDTNIKRILNEKIRELRSMTQEEHPKAGDTENVVVTWVVSPQKFFVQLRRRDVEISALKKELSEVPTKGQPLTFQQLSVGLKCVCLYEADGQWYRAVITSIDSENEIIVFYVDYGNTEVVRMSLLRKITGPCLINQMNVQGVQCALKGFENRPFDQDVANSLEGMILEKDLQMTVVSSEKEHMCVQLFDGGNDITAILLASLPKVNTLRINNNSDNDWEREPVNNESTSPGRFRRENGDSFQKKDSRNFRGDKNRPEEGDNWRDVQTSNEKNVHPNDKIYSNRGFKQDKENTGSDQRPWRNREFKQGDHREDSMGDRRKFDGNKGGRFKQDDSSPSSEGLKFDRNREWSSSSRTGVDPRKKFSGDRSRRSDKPTMGRDRKFDEPKNTRKPVRKEDVAPPGSKYEERIINIGTSENGIVTYYFSPDEFYIQLLDQKEEFEKMMDDIQNYYKDKYSLRDPVEAGDLVVAQFSSDKVLYRAEVIKPSPVTVRYVDYGNLEPVGPKSTWPVDKQFLNLPKQIIKCRLSNVRPIGSEWPPPGCEVNKFFGFEKYKCTFMALQGDTYEIKMEVVESGKDVASEIITAGLGQPLSPKIDVPKLDYSLLPNQVLRLCVSHVESSSKFYVTLNKKSVDIIEEDLKTYVENEKNLTPLDKSLLKTEMLCLSTRDNFSWHRGIIRKTDENHVQVWFCDIGDTVEITADKIMSLPEHLKVFQPQVAECFLHDVLDTVNEEEFKTEVMNGHYLVSIVSENDQRLGVVLYDTSGQKSCFQKGNNFPEFIEPVSHLPIICQNVPVVISHLESPGKIHIQHSIDSVHLASLNEEMSKFYAEDREDLEVEEGDKPKLVAVKSVANGNWSRGRLVSVTENGLEVFYIDHGNVEIVPRENVKKLNSSFCHLNAFSKKVSLDGEWKQDAEEAVNSRILELTRGKELIGYFINKNGEFISEFTIKEDRITELLRSESLITLNGEDNFKEILPRKETTPVAGQSSYQQVPFNIKSEELKVVISHIDSPNKFWVHMESEIVKLHEFEDKLQNCCVTLPEKDIVQAGDFVAALFYNKWYRARVLDVDNYLQLQLIDYGNVLNTSKNCNLVKELPQELISVPTFSTCYSLKGIWNENKTSQFEEIVVQSEEPFSLIKIEEGDPPIVDLFQNGQRVAEKLMEEIEDDLCTVYMIHSNSPDDFYIQRESCTDSLNTIDQCLLDADTFENISTVREGEVYVAKFPDDENWYRAKVVKKHPDGVEVFFIDYGNLSKVTEVKSLPSELADIPYLAENCSLIYGNKNDSWSEAACGKFAEYADNRPLKMKVILNRVNKPIVRLFHENRDVSEELGALCEDDGRSEVYVSHAQSPTDFYIQYVDNENYKFVARTLAEENESPELEDRQPGSLCQARFVEDGLWYRGKILQNLDEGCEIFFIDFGNVSISTEVKKLPPEIEGIPPLALRCSLKLPEKNIPESVKEEFINLTAGGETVFRARMITLGEVNMVSLKLDGRILEETLNIETISYDNISNFPTAQNHHRHLPDSMDDETDDDKNSKKNLMTDDYFISNLEDDAKAESSILNETDEEKRVKIAISGGEEGFRSDDEKGISEGRVLSGIVNATDNELMEEPEEVLVDEEHGEEEIEEVPSPEIEEERPEVGEEDPEVNEENPESGEAASEVIDSDNKTENCEDSSSTKTESNQRKNKVDKIVPGSISRGEENTAIDDSPSSFTKLKHSEKVVPGSISRGVSLESMASERETVTESPERQSSQSAPNTPKPFRKENTNGYVKIDQNDRLVPGCISTGVTLHCNSDVEKIPPSERIVPGSVNGSLTEE